MKMTIFSFFIVYSSSLLGQCPLTVDAGPDQAACAPSGTTTLQGSVTGTPLGFNWEPTIGLSNPNSLTPTVNVTGAETYTLTASAFDPTAPNLVNNPAFENGNTGFTSQLTQNPLPITPGTYVLTTSPSVVISNFPPCDDHTFGNGTGFMMLINGPAVAGTQVWCQNIPVTPNTWYSMSAWVTTSPISPPQLQFSVNGVMLGTPYTVQTNPCNWQQFAGAWYSGPATTADFCIVDQNGSGNGLLGDDFALDDIYFGEACSVSDDVTVSLVDVEAIVNPTVVLQCNDLPQGLTLDASGSSAGPNISYLWTTPDGNILSGATTTMPVVDADGTYNLTVTYNDGTTVCTDQAIIQVLPDPNVVFALIGPPDELNCDNPTVTLNGGGSSSGPTINYQWTPPTGILSGENSPNPVVNMGGTYSLIVTNSISGCTAMESVIVFENFNEPTAVASAADELTCSDTLVTLDGGGSSLGNEYTYLWTTTDGNIVSGAMTLNNCEVDSAGVYTLTVTNTQNGCTSEDFAIVTADTDAPAAEANAPTPIGCGGGEVELSGNGSSTGSGFDYLWTTVNGNIVNGQTTLTPTVDASAEYLLVVTDGDNGCTASDTTFLFENTATILIDIALPDTLNCVLLSQNLDATGSSQNPDLTYDWSTINGNIVSGGTTLTPEVDAPGTYTLTITDGPTGCSENSSVIVLEDVASPTAEAGSAMTIDCDAEPVELDGTGSDTGPNFSLEWTTSGGNFAAGENTLTPEVNAAGVYFLTITNLTNGCTAVDSTEVTQVGDAPVVDLVLNDTLDCATDTLTIDGSGSTSSAQILIEWIFTPPAGGGGGGFAAGQNTLTPEVDGAGTYTLTLTDQSTGCVGSGSVTVDVDTMPPTAILAMPPDLNCDSTTIHLDATASMGTGLLAISWEFLNGSGGIVGGANTLTPEVDEPGFYTVTLTSWENGCSATDTVAVTEDVTPPLAEAGASQTLTCDVTSVNLDGNGSSTGSEFEYLWTTSNGNITSGETTLMPTVDSPGTYVISVENTVNGCTALDSVTVNESADLPTAIIAPADTLTCDVTSLDLDGNGSSSGTGFEYLWTTGDGNIASGEMTLMPTIDAPGTYLLTVTNTLNNCTSTEEVTIFQNGDLPTAEAGQSFTLSCVSPDGMLDGTGSTTDGVSYLWTTLNGNILNGETTLSPPVNAPGTYTLTVTDDSNGCTATAEVIIDQDADLPVANAGLADTLTCLVGSLTLDGMGSSQGGNYTYTWTTSDGNLTGGQNTLTPMVDAPGTYLLTVTDINSFCESISSVTIAEVTEGPEIMVSSPGDLNCVDTILTINAMVDGQPDLIWATVDGEILSGETTAMPTIGAAGTYLLTATDGITGCTSIATVDVAENTTPPIAAIALPNIIDCEISEVTLDGNGSNIGPNFSYEWTTLGGGFTGGQNTLTPSVNAGGEYLLTVTNDDNGCSASASVFVMVDTFPPVAVANAPNQLGCTVQTVNLDGAGSSTGGDISYLWFTSDGNIVSGQTGLSPTVDAPGTYLLTVTNGENGCTSSASVTVTSDGDAPIALISQPNSLTCLDTLVLLDGSASTSGTDFNFTWSTVDGNLAGGQNTMTPEVDEPGTYVLIVENMVNGCADTAEVSVAQNIDPPGADAGTDAILTCDEPEIALDGGSPTLGVEFEWATSDGNILFGAASQMPGVDAEGTYVLTITDPVNGCTSVDEVEVADTALDEFFFSVTDANCETGEGAITFQWVQGGIGWYEYSIDGGATFSSEMVYENLPTGTYELAVQDSGGCLLTQEVAISEAIGVEVSLPQMVDLTLGESYQLNPILNISADDILEIIWSPAGGLSCSDCLTPVATPTTDAAYLLTLTDVNGCTASASTSIILAAPNNVVYVPNAFSPNGDGTNDGLVVFANPDLVQQVNRFLVFTRWGESVFENFNFPPNDFDQGWDGTHRGEELGGGVYVWFAEVTLTNGEKRFFEGEVNLLK